MKFFTQIAAILAGVAITSTSVVKSPEIPPTEGNFELLILHNNDMHARFEQTSQLSGACTTVDREAGKCYGGFPRVAHVVKEAREAAAKGQGPPVLYLNAGDTYTGTAWFTIYKWKIAAEFINALQPDAVSLGNNELQKGTSELSPFLLNLEPKILATNIIVKGQEEKLQKSLVFNVQGVPVGLVGYLTPDISVLDSAGNIEYIDEVISLKEEVAKLQAQGVEIIIALGHSTQEKNLEIAKEVEGIDLVITGHRNSYLWSGAAAESQQADSAIEVFQNSGKRVPVIQSFAYNNFLGKIQIEFDGSGDIAAYNTESILLDETIPQNEELVTMVNDLKVEMAARSEQVVGQTSVVLEGDSCKTAECNLGNLIADAINYCQASTFDGIWTDAPITIIPGGHINGSIAPSNRPADVTLGDLMTAFPVDNNIVAVTTNGTILLQVLEHAATNYSSLYPTGQFLQFSGVRVVYDFERNAGSRVVSSVARCGDCYVPEYYTIDDWRTYKILMPASLADGEYGYSMFAGLPREDLAYDGVTCIAEFINLRSPVYPEIAGRIELRNYEALEEVEGEEDGEAEGEVEGEVDGGEEEAIPDSAVAVGSALPVFLLATLLLIIKEC